MTITAITDSNNKHSNTTKEGLTHFKQLASSLDGWDFSEEQDNVKLYRKKLDDTSLPPLVRGDTILEDLPPGCTPLTVANVATFPGCRKIWDIRFDQAEVKEIYGRYEALFWVKLKAPWPISPRDFAGTSIREVQSNQTHVSMVSVEDEKIPEMDKAVRGKLIVSGWKMYETDKNKIGITYVSQTDLAGSIPATFLKKLLLEVPLCAGKVRNYISEYGFPPTMTLVDKHVEFLGEDFDHDSKTYTLDLKVSAAEGHVADILCSSIMYPNGVKVQVTQGQGDVEQNQDKHKNYVVVLRNLKGPQVGVTIIKS